MFFVSKAKFLAVIWLVVAAPIILFYSYLLYSIYDPFGFNIYEIPNKPQEFVVHNIDPVFPNNWGLIQLAYPHHRLVLQKDLPLDFQIESLHVFCKVGYIEVSGTPPWLGFIEVEWCHKM